MEIKDKASGCIHIMRVEYNFIDNLHKTEPVSDRRCVFRSLYSYGLAHQKSIMLLAELFLNRTNKTEGTKYSNIEDNNHVHSYRNS